MNDQIIPTVTIDSSDDLTLTVLYSPFDLSQRESCFLTFGYGKSIADYLGDLASDTDLVVAHNGQLVDHSLFALRFPHKGDHLVIASQVFGGGDEGGMKGAIRFVALAVVSAVAMWAGQAWAPSLLWAGAGPVATNMMVGAIASVVTMAGGMLVNKLLPMPDPEDRSVQGRSPTYGFGKPQTIMEEGSALPVIYGEHYTGGVLIGRDISIVPDTNDEHLRLIYALSDGEIYNVSDVQINDHPIESYQDASYQWHSGKLEDKNAATFSPVIRTQVKMGRKLSEEWLTVSLPAGTNHVEGIVNFPRGLIAFNREDMTDRSHANVAILMEYRVEGGTWKQCDVIDKPLNWGDVTSVSNRRVFASFTVESAQAINRGEIVITRRASQSSTWNIIRTIPIDTNFAGVSTYSYTIADIDDKFQNTSGTRYAYQYAVRQSQGNWNVTQATLTQTGVGDLYYSLSTLDSVRFEFDFAVNTRQHDDVYEVRFKRSDKEQEPDPDATTGTQINSETWVSVIEAVTTIPVEHRGTALLCVDIKASDQLTSLPAMLSKVKGRVVNIYSRKGEVIGRQWSNNPAWIALDIMIAFGKMNPSRIHFNAFIEWATFCINNELTFNGIFDTTLTIWDNLQKVLRAGLAQANPLGVKFSLIIHQPRNPTMLFTSSNIIEGSYSTSWTSNNNRSNIFEGEYFDGSDYNKRTKIKVIDPDVNEADRGLRPMKISLMGVTNAKQAEKLMGCYRALNKYMVMSINFDAYLDAIACTLGDVVRVQNDHVQWGKSWRAPERILRGLTIHCDISDEDVGSNGAYFMAHYPLLPIGLGLVRSFNSITDEITIDTINNWEYIHFIQRNDVGEYIRVDYSYQEDGLLKLVVKDGHHFATGEAITLIQGDGVFKSPITAITGSTITIANNLPMDIEKDAVLAIGQSSVVAKDFIVTSISGDGEFMRKISGIEYNASLFTIDGEYDYVPPTTEIKLLTEVQQPHVAEHLYKDGKLIRSRVVVSWQPPAQGNYHRAKVSIRKEADTHPKIVWSVPGINQIEIDQLSNNESVDVGITAIDILGRVCPTEVKLSYTAVAQQAPPATVKNITTRLTFSGILVKWDANKEIDVVGYQVRIGSDWDSGTIVVERTDSTQTIVSVDRVGVYQVMVKAIDALGIMSVSAASAEHAVKGPNAVTGFVAIQNGRLLVLNWDAHIDPDVRSFIITRGDDYTSATPVATVSGNTFTADIDIVDENTKFWIVPVDHFGLIGSEPVYSVLIFNAFEGYNIVIEEAISPTWAGEKINLTINSDGTLKGSNSEVAFSYYHQMHTVIDEPMRLLLRDYPFVLNTGETWAEANYSWQNAGNQLWLPNGLNDNQTYTRFVSRALHALPDSTIEGYDCYDSAHTLRGVRGSYANSTATLSAGALLRGGTKGIGFKKGQVRFALKPSSKPTQVYCSFAPARACLVTFASGSLSQRLKIWHDNAAKKLFVEHNGTRYSLDKGKTRGGIANMVVNILAYNENGKTSWFIGIQDEPVLLTITAMTQMNGDFSTVTIGSNDSQNTPCGYIRHIRQEEKTGDLSDVLRAEYLNSYSRTCFYSHFTRYLSGYYQAPRLDFKYLVNTKGEHAVGLAFAAASLDVPDVFDRGRETTNATGSIEVRYHRKFLTPPEVVVQVSGGENNKPTRDSSLAYAYDITNTGFRLVCYKNNSSDFISRDVTWQAIGY